MWDFFKGFIELGFWAWAFLAFGLPLLFGILALTISGFSEGAFLAWTGRMNRLSFIVNSLIVYVSMFIGVLIFAYGGAKLNSMVLMILGGIIILLTLARFIAIVARRFHDFNLPGICALIFVAFNILFGGFELGDAIGVFINFLLWVIPGNKSVNSYGDISEKRISV